MNNFIQPGKTLTLTAPAGGVVGGVAVQIGQLLVVASGTVDEFLPFEGATEGVFTLPKNNAEAFTEGQLVYWDGTEMTTTAGINLLVGVAAEDATDVSTESRIRLDGVARFNGGQVPANFSNGTRPDPATQPIGFPIYNTDDSAPNYSDGVIWRDAAGDPT